MVMPGGGGSSAVWVGGVVAVQAEQGVEMDRAAGLVFGGLAVRDADLAGQAAVPGGLVQVPFDGLLGAPPQLTRLVVPHHVGGVVVAVRAQRLAEPGIIAAVPGEAGGGRPCAQVAASRRAWQG